LVISILDSQFSILAQLILNGLGLVEYRASSIEHREYPIFLFDKERKLVYRAQMELTAPVLSRPAFGGLGIFKRRHLVNW
jgi:hypothetical protein